MTLHDLILLAIPVVVSVAALFVGKIKLSENRRDTVLHFATLAYGVVEEVSRLTETDIDDKAAAGLKQLLDLLKANNLPELSAGETALVKAHFSAMSAGAAQQEALAAPPA